MDNMNKRLQQVRENAGLTKAQISSLLGIYPPTWQKYETGKNKMSADTIYKFCKTLNVSADWLLGLTDER